MKTDWKQAEPALKQVVIKGNEQNTPVILSNCPSELHCIGIGTDAAVFSHDLAPGYAFKIYSDEAISKKEVEESVYLRLKGSPYFPTYYGKGENYIVLSLEEGVTLYDCLIQGIPVPKQAIEDVGEARQFVRSIGLNPRDIHLKNVLLQEGRGKVLDVSEYVQEGNDHRWEHLVWAYDHIYPLMEGYKLPAWVLETIKSWYKRLDHAGGALEEFAQQAMQLFLRNRK